MIFRSYSRVSICAFLAVIGILSRGHAVQSQTAWPDADARIVSIGGSALFPTVLQQLGTYALLVAAFTGGLTTTWIVHRSSRVAGRTIIATMLLAGIAINVLAGSGIGTLSFIASDAQLRSIVFWNLGSLGGAHWSKVWPTLIYTLPAVFVLCHWFARPLNVLLLGEAEATHLGIPIEWVKRGVVGLVALMVGASVAVAGQISFIGLVTPHLLRLLIGPDHRYLLPVRRCSGRLSFSALTS